MPGYPINSVPACDLCETPLGRAVMVVSGGSLVATIPNVHFSRELEEDIESVKTHFTKAGMAMVDVHTTHSSRLGMAVSFEMTDTASLVPLTYTGKAIRIAPMADGNVTAVLGDCVVEFESSPAALLTRDGDTISVKWVPYRGRMEAVDFENHTIESLIYAESDAYRDNALPELAD